MTEHYNVVIATPGHSLMAQYVKSLLETTKELDKQNITWKFVNSYASHVGDARETTIGGEDPQFIHDTRPFKGEITYDKLFWIDSDIAWTPEQFLKIYNSDKDVVSGAYLLATGQVVAYEKLMGPPYMFQDIVDKLDLMQVHSAGFGFIAIKQGVFEALSRPWFQSVGVTMLKEDGTEYPFMLMGEDYSWCERVNRAGFKVWLDPTVRVTHHKMMQLTWKGIQP